MLDVPPPIVSDHRNTWRSVSRAVEIQREGASVRTAYGIGGAERIAAPSGRAERFGKGPVDLGAACWLVSGHT